jgi:NAD(P)-dependent dehydrogenase (short-subunit alcohol dehydrogenase family)
MLAAHEWPWSGYKQVAVALLSLGVAVANAAALTEIRLGTADDQAAAIAWLPSPASSWNTGQVLSVDSGLRTVQAK